MKRSHIGLFISSTLFLLALAACSGAKNSRVSMDQVRVQLSWLHSIVFSQFYMAQEIGYYADENLGVEILNGGFDAQGEFIVPVDMVVSGQAEFGIVDGANLLTARENGAPVVAIASIFQSHPLALVSLGEKHITNPKDLVGAHVDMTYNSRLNYSALLQAEEINAADVITTNRTDLTTQSLINSDVDVIDAWVITEVAELTAAGTDINLIIPAEYGIDIYPNVIFTTEAMVADNPQLVERFLRATLKGLQATIDDPVTAVDLFLTYDSTRGEVVENLAMQQAIPLFLPAGSQPGMMHADVWNFTYEVLRDQQILSAPLDVSEAYTTHFLNAVAPRK